MTSYYLRNYVYNKKKHCHKKQKRNKRMINEKGKQDKFFSCSLNYIFRIFILITLIFYSNNYNANKKNHGLNTITIGNNIRA